MRLALLTVTLTCSLSLGSAVAGEPQGTETGAALLKAVAASPVSLSDVLQRTHRSKHHALRARFALDADGQLVAQVLLGVTEKEQRSFHEWGGPVYSGGWVPQQRVLVDKAELVEAARLSAVALARDVLWQAVAHSVRKDRAERLADTVVSAVPSSRGGNKAVDLFVGLGGLGSGLAFDPSTRTFAAESVAAPARVPVEARSLPALEVPEGRWFNTEEAPTLVALRGRPVLVLVTSPG